MESVVLGWHPDQKGYLMHRRFFAFCVVVLVFAARNALAVGLELRPHAGA